LPFAENYGVPYTSFSLWPGSYTRLGNYLLVYGLFLLFIITYLVLEFRSWTKSWTQKSLASWEPFVIPVFLGLFLFAAATIFLFVKGYWIAPLVLTLVIVAGLLALKPGLPIERRIILILIAGALSLTLLVEFIVLDGDIGRMNTVFKFYMQVWVLLSVVSGVVAVWSWSVIRTRRGLRRAWGVALALLLAAAALYPILATKAKWDIRMSDEAPVTLDGMVFMESTSYNDTALDGSSRTVDLEHDYQALQWMQRNIEGSPVVAEAHSSNPYRSTANRVAMYTGLPAIIGWDWHQRQQRAVLPPSIVGDRIFDVNTLYNTLDSQEALAILDKYDVSYVYVGPLEWTYYNPQGLVKFDNMVELGLLREVYRNAGVSIYEVIA
jgi:YYY domain-containing protein